MKALDIAKYIVTKCVNDNCPISNLQLQKFLFYIQKEFLAQNKVAFYDEIQAWQFGPVVPVVYYHFCGLGAMPITTTYTVTDICTEYQTIIDSVVDKKRILDPWEMVRETHKDHGAWDLVYMGGKGNHKEIPRDLIKRAG